MSAHVTVKQEVYSALRLATERYRDAAEGVDEIVGDSDQEEFHRLVLVELEYLAELYKAGRIERDDKIRVGDTVRILPIYEEKVGSYDDLNVAGAEFVVTEVVDQDEPFKHDGRVSRFYVSGDPEGRGIWETYVEKVQA